VIGYCGEVADEGVRRAWGTRPTLRERVSHDGVVRGEIEEAIVEKDLVSSIFPEPGNLVGPPIPIQVPQNRDASGDDGSIRTPGIGQSQKHCSVISHIDVPGSAYRIRKHDGTEPGWEGEATVVRVASRVGEGGFLRLTGQEGGCQEDQR
jgi:hypothetical protein